MAEATAVSAEGRISPMDAGIWKDSQVDAWRRIVGFVQDRGAVAGIQLAHAGWKGSTDAPWRGGKEVPIPNGGWAPLGVDNQPFAEGYPTPVRIESSDIDRLCNAWRDAAMRAVDAGFRTIEIHAAHGYLFHSFLSPLSNRRNDDYGGTFENRTRFLLRVTRIVRDALPGDLPLFVRLSCTDWAEGGWSLEDSIRLALLLRDLGVDLIDCSSGGAVPKVKIPVAAGYQVPFAEAIRGKGKIPTAAVGMITEPRQAEEILRSGQADMVLLARQMLRDPYWPVRAAHALDIDLEARTPDQYLRAW